MVVLQLLIFKDDVFNNIWMVITNILFSPSSFSHSDKDTEEVYVYRPGKIYSHAISYMNPHA